MLPKVESVESRAPDTRRFGTPMHQCNTVILSLGRALERGGGILPINRRFPVRTEQASSIKVS